MVRLVKEGEKQVEQNPLLFDDELKDLLSTLSEIKSYKRFKGWKQNFLDRLETLMEEKGVEKATTAYSDFSDMMQKMVKYQTKCDDMIAKGKITSVMGRRALSEMCTQLQEVCHETDELIPSSKNDEKKRRYNKFQLGCVLVKDGFSQFDNMKALSESVLSMGKEGLKDVVDKMQLDLFVQYGKEFKKFCDVMEDLGLYEVMLACRKFAEEPEEEEVEPINITIETDDGKKIKLELDPGETIGNIKDAIVDACGIPAADQIMKFRGKALNDNNKTLDDLLIPDKAVLKVSPPTIPITVNTMDGKKIKIMANPQRSIAELKKQLEDESGIPADKQKLFFQGAELKDDNMTAQDYGIKPGSELDLEPKSLKVNVEMPDGKKIEVDIEPSDTADKIKQRIQQKTGMEVPRQVLKLNGKELPKTGTVKDMGIKDGDDIKVEIFKVPVSVTTMDGKKYKMMVDPTDVLGDLKKKLEGKSNIPASNQNISMNGKVLQDDNKTAGDHGIKEGSELYLEPKGIKVSVEMPDGKKVDVDVKPSDTAKDIKQKIKDKTGMDVPRQVLKFKGKELPADGTVKDLGIRDGDDLKVDIFKVPITVNTIDGKKIKVMVDPSDKLSDIKKQLEKESGLPASNQNLFKEGTHLDDDNKTAGDYGIKEGSVLDLEPKKIKVTVEMPDGKKVEVDVEPSDKAADIKKKIKVETGMDVPRQVLKFKGKELPADGTVKDLGIRDGDDLKVDIFKVPITVNTIDGKKIKVFVDPTDKLRDIKVQLEKDSGVPADNQNLFMDGSPLNDDDKTAGDYGIKEGSELDLEPKKIKVTVEMPDGKKVEVDIKPSDKAADIKKKIHDNTGMEVPRQVLKFNGKELPADGTVKDLGIRDGDDLKVDIFKVPITVNTMEGKKYKMMVDPTDSLLSIKKKLEGKTEIPASNQNLLMDGKVLDGDDVSCAEHGIQEGSVLDLEPKSIKVNVEMPDGKTVQVPIKPSDTSKTIKQKIKDETGMSVPRQVLKMNGKELPDGKTVKDMGIKDGDDLKVDIFKVPITVNTMDGKKIKVNIDPTDSLGDIKKQLKDLTGVDANNQKLFMDGKELNDDSKSAGDYGIKAGSELDLEPKSMNVNVEMPDGSTVAIKVTPDDTGDGVKKKIENETGMAVPRQVLKFVGNELKGRNKTLKDLGVADGSTLNVEIFKIPITVETPEKKIIKLDIEPIDTIDKIKKMLAKKVGMEPEKQCLKLDGEELKNGGDKAEQCGIKANTQLTVEPHMDPIIFVDIKCGTLFAVDREEVLKQNALTMHQNNKLDFTEAAKSSPEKDKIKNVMLESPRLGVAPQVVVQKLEVDDYDLAEAEKVKNKFGVSLKKREKNKKGEEFIYVDPKTGACGELSRKKYVDMGFITPQGGGKSETLKEAEKDTQMYDKFVAQIRDVFGIASAK